LHLAQSVNARRFKNEFMLRARDERTSTSRTHRAVAAAPQRL
jgi:hypothetical protein